MLKVFTVGDVALLVTQTAKQLRSLCMGMASIRAQTLQAAAENNLSSNTMFLA